MLFNYKLNRFAREYLMLVNLGHVYRFNSSWPTYFFILDIDINQTWFYRQLLVFESAFLSSALRCEVEVRPRYI